MCFSAPASFGAAAVLVSTGAAASALNGHERNKAFVAIPFIFGLQQASEGVVWMTLQKASMAPLHQAAVTIFLAIALALWPAWVPWSVHTVETSGARRAVLKILGAAGLFFATCAVVVLAVGKPRSEIVGQCLNYTFLNDVSSVFPPNLHSILYFSSSVLPFFVSSNRMIRTTGALILGGLLVTLAFWQYAVTSVWCFFAAIASFYVAASVYFEERSLKLA